MLEEDLETLFVDPHALANRLQLRLALHRPRVVELDIEGNELTTVERRVIANGHHVVQPVHAEAPPAGSSCPVGDVRTRPIDEDLLQLRRAVLADVPCLAGEDDERVTVGGDDDVGVPVDDLEARQVGHGSLETRVLGA